MRNDITDDELVSELPVQDQDLFENETDNQFYLEAFLETMEQYEDELSEPLEQVNSFNCLETFYDSSELAQGTFGLFSRSKNEAIRAMQMSEQRDILFNLVWLKLYGTIKSFLKQNNDENIQASTASLKKIVSSVYVLNQNLSFKRWISIPLNKSPLELNEGEISLGSNIIKYVYEKIIYYLADKICECDLQDCTVL